MPHAAHRLRYLGRVRALLGVFVWLTACGFDVSTSSLQDSGGGRDSDNDAPPVAVTSPRILTFDTQNIGTVQNAPVLVRLDPSRIDYRGLSDPRTDLRFEDPDGTMLPFDVEVWTPDGVSVLWVKVPQIDGGSTADFIRMHFGPDCCQMMPASDLVWSDHELVTHMGATVIDAANAYDGVASGTSDADGLAGPATAFTGDNQRVTFPTSGPLLDGWQTWSVELWVRPSYANVAEADGRGNAVIDKGSGSALQIGRLEVTAAQVLWFQADIHYEVLPTAYINTSVDLSVWTYLVYSSDGSILSLFKNGNLVATASRQGRVEYGMTDIVLGGASPFLGAIDELRISDRAVTADWLKVQYRSMMDQLVTFSGT